MNEAVTAYRELNPGDTRSDDEITLWLGTTYPGQYDGYGGFTESMARIQRDQEAAAEQARRDNAPGLLKEAEIGLARGLYGLKSTAAAGTALGLRALGAEDWSQGFLETAARNAEYAAANAGTISKVEDIKSVGDAIQYIAGGAGEVTPSIVEAIGIGLIGAAAGTAGAPGPGTGGGFIAGVIGKQSAKSLLKKEVDKVIKSEVKDLVMDELKDVAAGKVLASAVKNTATKELLKQEMRATSGRWAANTAVLANSQLLSSGEIFSDLTSNGIDPDEAINTALVGGFIAAVPDSFLPAAVVSRAFPGVTNKALKQTIMGDVVKKYAELPVSIGGEAITEAFQELVNVEALRYEQGGLDEMLKPLSPEDISRMKNAATLGGLGGGLAGGGSMAFHKLIKQEESDKIKSDQEKAGKETDTFSEMTKAERDAVNDLAEQVIRERFVNYGLLPETQAKVDALTPAQRNHMTVAEAKVMEKLTPENVLFGDGGEREGPVIDQSLVELAARVDRVRKNHPGISQAMLELIFKHGEGDIASPINRIHSSPPHRDVPLQPVVEQGVELADTGRGRLLKDLQDRGQIYLNEGEIAEFQGILDEMNAKEAELNAFIESELNKINEEESVETSRRMGPQESGAIADPIQDIVVQALADEGAAEVETPIQKQINKQQVGLARVPAEGEVDLNDLASPAEPLSVTGYARESFFRRLGNEGAFYEMPPENIEAFLLAKEGDIDSGRLDVDSVFMIDVADDTGAFIGTVSLTGYETKDEAIAAFNDVADGGETVGAITEITRDRLADWKKSGKKLPGARSGFDTPFVSAKQFKGRIPALVGDIDGGIHSSDLVVMIDSVDEEGNFAGTFAVSGFQTKQEAIAAAEKEFAAVGATVGSATVTNRKGYANWKRTGISPGAKHGFDTPYATISRFKGRVRRQVDVETGIGPFSVMTSAPEDVVQLSGNLIQSVDWRQASLEKTGNRRDPGAYVKELWYRFVSDDATGYNAEIDEILVGQSSVKNNQTGTNRLIFFEVPNKDGSISVRALGIRKSPGAIDPATGKQKRETFVMSWPGHENYGKEDVFDEEGKLVKSMAGSRKGTRLETAMSAYGLRPIAGLKLNSTLTKDMQWGIAGMSWTRDEFEDLIGNVADNLFLTYYDQSSPYDAFRDVIGENDALADASSIVEQHSKEDFAKGQIPDPENEAGGDQSGEFVEGNPAIASDLIRGHVDFVHAVREIAGNRYILEDGSLKKGITLKDWRTMMENFAIQDDNYELVKWAAIRAVESLTKIDPKFSENPDALSLVQDLIQQITYHAYVQGYFDSDHNIFEDWFERAEDTFQREAFSIPGSQDTKDGVAALIRSGLATLSGGITASPEEALVTAGKSAAKGSLVVQPGQVPPEMRRKWTTVFRDGKRITVRMEKATESERETALIYANLDEDYREYLRKIANNTTWMRGTLTDNLRVIIDPGISKAAAKRHKPEVVDRKIYKLTKAERTRLQKLVKDAKGAVKDSLQEKEARSAQASLDMEGKEVVTIRTVGGVDLTLEPDMAPVAYLLNRSILGRTAFKSQQVPPMVLTVQSKPGSTSNAKARAAQKNREAAISAMAREELGRPMVETEVAEFEKKMREQEALRAFASRSIPASMPHIIGGELYAEGASVSAREVQAANLPLRGTESMLEGNITEKEFLVGNVGAGMEIHQTLVDLTTGLPGPSKGEIKRYRSELISRLNKDFGTPTAEQKRKRREFLSKRGINPDIVEHAEEIAQAGEADLQQRAERVRQEGRDLVQKVASVSEEIRGVPGARYVQEADGTWRKLDAQEMQQQQQQEAEAAASPQAQSLIEAQNPTLPYREGTAQRPGHENVEVVGKSKLKTEDYLNPKKKKKKRKHRFSRPASMPDVNPEQRDDFNELLGVLNDAGVTVEQLDLALESDMLTAETLGFYIGEDGHPIEAAIYDSMKMTIIQGLRNVAAPTRENFRQLLHETGHHITLHLPEPIQRMVLEALDAWTNEKLGLSGSLDPGIVGNENERLQGDALRHERLAELLSFRGLDQKISKSWAAQIMRHIKDVIFRGAMWVQRRLLGKSHTSPEMAIAFMENRMAMFRGKPAPFFSFIGGKKLKAADVAAIYEPVRGTGWVPEWFDWSNGKMITEPVVSDDSVAMRHNLFSQGVFFNSPSMVTTPKVAGGDDATVAKMSEYAALTNVEDNLQLMFHEFETAGLNIDRLSYDKFVTDILGERKLPVARRNEINRELEINGHEPVKEGIGIRDLRDQDLASKLFLLKMQKIHQRWARVTAKAATNTPIIEARIERMKKRLAKMEKAYKEADTLWLETRATLLGSIRMLDHDLRHFGEKAWSKSLLTMHLEKFLNREVVPADQRVVDDFVKGIQDNRKAFESFLSAVARLDLDWSRDSAELIEDIKSNALTSGKYDTILKDVDSDGNPTAESAVLRSVITTFARQNPRAMAWMTIREKQESGEVKPEDAQALRAALEAIREGAKVVDPRLLEAAHEVIRTNRAAASLQKEYMIYKRDVSEWERKAKEFKDVTKRADDLQSLFAERMAAAEAKVGVSMPVDMIEGARLIVPPSADASLAEVEKAPRFKFTRTLGRGRDRKLKEIRDIIKVSEDWLKSHEDSARGKIWMTVADTVRKLKMEEAENKHLAIRRSAWVHHIGSIVDKLVNTGTDGGRRGAVSLRRYQAGVERFESDAQTYGLRWERARSDAWEASGIASSEQFTIHVYDRGLKFIESMKHLIQTEENPEAAVLEALRRHFAKDPRLSATLDEAWPAYERLFNQTKEVNEWFDTVVRKELGLKVKDDILGLMRESMGRPMFTVSRTLNRRMRSLYRDMASRGWSGTRTLKQGDTEVEEDVLPFEKPHVKKKDQIKEAYLENKDGLAATLGTMLTPDIVEMFIEPMVKMTGRSLFYAPTFVDGVRNLATTSNTEKAWRDSGGDLIQFATNLYELEGGPDKLATKQLKSDKAVSPEEDLAAFVGETVSTFYNFFANIANIQIQQDNSIMAVEHGRSTTSLVPHQLMDSRKAEDFPPEWLEYQRYDQSITRIMVHQMSIHAHLGRDMNEVNSNIRVAVDELKKMSEEYQRLQAKIINANPDIDFDKIRHRREFRRLMNEAAKVRAKELGEDADTFLMKAEAGFEGAGDAEQLVDKLHSWFKAQGSGLVELKAVMEVLNTMTGAIIQGPKTTLLNFMSLNDPITKWGVSSVGSKQVLRNWKSLMGETFGSLFQAFNIQINKNSEYALRRQRIGRKDSSLHVSMKDRNAAIMSQELAGGPIQRGIVRTNRLIRSVLFETGFGKAPEEGVEYVKFRPQAAFSWMVQVMNNAIIDGVWSSYDTLVQRGVDFVKNPANLERVAQSDFEFTAEDLGYKSGVLFDDKVAFERLTETMKNYGMVLEHVVFDASRNDGGPLFTDEQYSMLASMALNEISLESSVTNQPAFFMDNAFLRFSRPLLGYSFARMGMLREGSRDAKSQAFAFKTAMKTFAAIVPIGIAWTLLMDEYDEELTGKKSDLRSFSGDDDMTGIALTFLERTARVGTFGLAGDIANGFGNMAEGGDMRGISFDHRVVWMNALKNWMYSVTALSRTGITNANYKDIYRPMMQAMGGGGYIQYAQIINKAIAPDLPFFRDEAAVTRRINAQNYLRTVGRELNLDVRTGSGQRSLPNAIRPHVSQMILASLGNNAVDFEAARRKALKEAEADVREKNPGMSSLEVKGEAVSRVKMMFQSAHPLRIVFKTTPTEVDFKNMISRLPKDGQQDVSEAVNLINSFGAKYLDVTPNVGSSDKKKRKKKSSVADFQRAALLGDEF